MSSVERMTRGRPVPLAVGALLALVMLSAGCDGGQGDAGPVEDRSVDREDSAGAEPEDETDRSAPNEEEDEDGEEQTGPPEVGGPKGWSLTMDMETWYEENTGPRDLDQADLSVREGGLNLEEDGEVLENVHVDGPIYVLADDVTVRNVVVDGTLDLGESERALIEDVIVRTEEAYPINASSARDWTVRYTEVDGMESPDNNGGLFGGDGAVEYSEFHSHTDSAKVESNSVWEYNWLHTNSTWGTDAHVDGLQSMGASDVLVRRNYIDMPSSNEANSAIIAQSNFGAIRNWTVKENYLNGGNYTIFFRGKGHGDPEDIVIEHNRIGRDYRYGLLSSDGDVQLSQNFWADTGDLID
jgi:hypothetical protein